MIPAETLQHLADAHLEWLFALPGVSEVSVATGPPRLVLAVAAPPDEEALRARVQGYFAEQGYPEVPVDFIPGGPIRAL